MKSLPFLAAACCAALPAPASAWQNHQNADLILGSSPARGLVRDARSIALDPATGKLYVADPQSDCVFRFSSQDKLLTGAPPEAVFGKTAAASPPAGSILQDPQGLAVDPAGRLWVAGPYLIYRWDHAAARGSGVPADGVFGAADFTSPPYAASDPRRLAYSMKLVTDAAGNLFVSCQERNSILRFDAAATKPNGAAADAWFGQISFTNTTAGLSPSRVSGPGDMVLRGTTLWIHDRNNRRLVRLDNAATRSSGAAFDAQAGQSSFYVNDSQVLAGGTAMHISPGGVLHVAAGASIFTWSNADALSGLLPAPLWSAAFPASGPFHALLCETDSRRWTGAQQADHTYPSSVPVRRLESLPSTSPASTLGSPPYTTLALPGQVAVDPVSGKVFVSDQVRHTVVRFASLSSLASNAPAEATLRGGNPSGTGGLSGPTGLCVDSAGRLYVADTGNRRVVRWDNAAHLSSNAPFSAVIGGNPNPSAPVNEIAIVQPVGVTIDAGGTLWVLDYYLARALRFDQAALRNGQIPADGMLGKFDFADPWTSGAPGRFYRPVQIQMDHAGSLWVLDSGGVDETTGTSGSELRLFRYDQANSKPAGAMPDNTIKWLNYVFGPLNAFAVTPDNTLWVASQASGVPVVKRFDNASSVVTGTPHSAILGSGASGSGAGEFGGSIASMSTDPPGNLWVSDPSNRRVMRFSAAPPPPGPEGVIFAASRNEAGFHGGFNAVPGKLYYLDSSTDLLQWAPAAVQQALTQRETLTDPAPSGPHRYYRVRPSP